MQTSLSPCFAIKLWAGFDMDALQFNYLNIGCGTDIRESYINLDVFAFSGVDMVHDIRLPWPFPDQCFVQMLAFHVLEHVPDLVFVMNEAYRCMAPGGNLFIKVPWWSGEWARGDPAHCRQFDHNSFSPFSDWFSQYAHLGICGPWIKVSQEYVHRSQDENSAFLCKLGFSTCREMAVHLRRPAGG